MSIELHIYQSNSNDLLRKLLKFVGILLLIGGIIGAVVISRISHYLESNEPKLLANLAGLPNNTLSFESTSFSLVRHFPKVTLIANHVEIRDTSLQNHQPSFLKIGIVEGQISLADFWSNNIEIESVKLRKGKIHWWRDTLGYANFDFKPKRDTTQKLVKPFWKNLNIQTHLLDFALEDIEIQIQNDLKSSNLHGHIDYLTTDLDLTQSFLESKVALALRIHELSFKEKRGTFLTNTQAEGVFNFNWQDSLLTIHPFPLAIDAAIFTTSATINWKANQRSVLIFENQAAVLDTIIPWLPEHIQQGLRPYKIPQPFYAKTTINTNFLPGDNPVVRVDFALDNHLIYVEGFPFRRTKLKGTFRNRLFEDERQWQEGRKRFKLNLSDVEAVHQDFTIRAPRLQVTKTARSPLQLKATTTISGRTEAISNWFSNEQFFFEGGQFTLSADVEGNLKDMDAIIAKTDARLELNDFSVIYGPANVRFPFYQMTLEKQAGDAHFTIINTSFSKGHDLVINGDLRNIPALLLDANEEKVSSTANITSTKITWSDFLNFFEANGLADRNYNKNEREKKQSMKKTVQGIYTNFNPRLTVQVDTLAYFDLLRLDKFQAGLKFEDEHTLVLEKTSFEYDGGQVDFSGKMDIRNPNQTPFEFELHTSQLDLKQSLPSLNYLNISMLANLGALPEALDLTIRHKGIIDDELGLIPNTSTGEINFEINGGKDLKGRITYQPVQRAIAVDSMHSAFGQTQIELTGNPKVFNNFFKTEQFFFKEGAFKVSFNYLGNPKSILELLSSGDATFALKDSEVYYQPADVSFPLSAIDLTLKDDTAIFEFDLTSDSLAEKIHLIGNLSNISELLIGNTGKEITTDVEISSKKIEWNSLFNLLSNKDVQAIEQKSASAKASVRGILNTFHPHLHVQIDSFIYSDKLAFRYLNGGVYLRDTATIVLEETDFGFQDGQIQVNGEFDVGQLLLTPFTANIQTQSLGLQPLIESLDYLNLPSLQGMSKLGGNVTMNFDFAGTIDDRGNGLITNATKGRLRFDLQDVLVIGFEPLDAIAARMRMRKRFEELRFAPISGELSISGQEIEFPRLEIQSNAIHLFLEGTLSYGDLTNMWVSIPLKNLRRRNRWVIPEKTGYAAPKMKVYIEVTSDQDGQNRFKFRLSKRKFYKHRGILDQFRKDKKRWRAIRRALRKAENPSLTGVIPVK